MVWFRENWCEEVLRQLRLGLAKCYTLAFENRGAVNDANISVSTHNFLKKLVSTFGIGLGRYCGKRVWWGYVDDYEQFIILLAP